MARSLATMRDDARRWIGTAVDAGWLDQRALEAIDAVEHAKPDQLFREPLARPMVVALFGGTGVGKSSLLNRLAGQPLARTGVERPTSLEATLYLHESIALAELPAHLPVSSVHVARHSNAAQRHVAWLDMPDIDSVTEANRQIALTWLPYIDLVCYVVSPERYRDDRGWRVLLDRRERHGWLFIMNRWDEGHPDQAADFERLLKSAGFESPTLVRTSCRPQRGASTPLVSPDEFDRVLTTASALAESSTSQLSLAAELARIRDVRRILSTSLLPFGDEQVWERATAQAVRRWDETSRAIATGLEYSLRAAANQFGQSDAIAWRGAVGALIRGTARAGVDKPASAASRDTLTPQLWDGWADSKLAACIDAAEVDSARLGLASRPLRAALEAAHPQITAAVSEKVGDGLRAALALPGTALTRAARRLTGFLSTFLPFLALLWIAFGVVRGFYAGVHGGQAFLGSAFAINSIALLAVSWAVPFAIDWRLRPSLRDAAERGLRDGLNAGLLAAGERLRDAVDAARIAALGQRDAGVNLLRACDERLAAPLAPETASVVARVA